MVMYMAEYATTFCHSMGNTDGACNRAESDSPLDDGQGRGQRPRHQSSLHCFIVINRPGAFVVAEADDSDVALLDRGR
jgi:hypothetical protein